MGLSGTKEDAFRVDDEFATWGFDGRLGEAFYVWLPPNPEITALVPAKGPIGSIVRVAGRYFGAVRGSSYVDFNGTPATEYLSWSSTSIRCRVPEGATSGDVYVEVLY